MDPLAALLEGTRARGAFVLRSTLVAPWSLRIEDGAPLTVVALARGSAFVRTDAGERGAVGLGSVAVLRGPGHYVVSDAEDRPAQVVIDADQVCRAADGGVSPMGPQGVRSWGNSPVGETVLLTGTYRTPPEVSRHLLAALPALIVLPPAAWSEPLLGYLAGESESDEPGQQAVLDRLLDLLLIAALRAWFGRPDAAAPGWFLAHADPVVGPALALIHDRPADPWDVATLAAAAGSSRANLARRFSSLVGSSPIGYLTDWRLSLAADLLTETDATLEAVARKVGYGDAFSLSTAFKRVRGTSPSAYRVGARA